MTTDHNKSELYEVVGYYLLQPIANLVEQIENARPEVPHFHSPVYLENSFSAAMIPLIITFIDSFVDWSVFLMKKRKSNKHPVQIIINDYNEPGLAKEVNELYMARHAIVHAYVWRREVEFKLDDGYTEYSEFELLEGYGKESFINSIDLSSAKTKILGINVIPTRMTRRDILIILQLLHKLVIKIEEKTIVEGKNGKDFLNISGQYVSFQGRVILFTDMLRMFTSR